MAIGTFVSVDPSLLRLLQLVSPALPIGLYSYSQGLEKAVEDGWLTGEREVHEWLSGLLEQVFARTDGAVLVRLYSAWATGDAHGLLVWSRYLSACRETRELRLEDLQTGQALARLLTDLGVPGAKDWIRHPNASQATLFSLAGVRFGIARPELVAGYCWGWLENQVLGAIKLVPLGQVSGQRLLAKLALLIPAAVEESLTIADNDLGASSPALAIASSRHESQYSRLFRS